MSAELIASRHNATLILTLSNPAAKNALHPDMSAAAIEALSTAERDETIRAVVLHGADNFFSSGLQLSRMLENRARAVSDQAEALDHLHGWIEALQGCPKPVIAAVEGTASGAAFSLALACDLIVASASAEFVMPNVKVGLTPDGGASWFLTQGLPRQLAAEFMLYGRPVSSQRLQEAGVVNRRVPDGMVLSSALRWADELAENSPHAIEVTKGLIAEAPENTLAGQFDAEKESYIEALHHPDAMEGVNAFFDKRKPEWSDE
jgi:enoyl-CoA hydratase/carnithine racemase